MALAFIPTVLIVDATPVSAEALQSILHADGFHVTKSVSGKERALAEIRQNQPDIVCAELVELDAEDLALLAAMRQEFPNLPLVVISGNADRAQVSQVIALGVVGFILLPFAAAEVQATFQRVKSHLRRKPPKTKAATE